MYVCVYVYTCANGHMCVYFTYLFTYLHTIYIYMYVYNINMHTYTGICAYMCMYPHVQSQPFTELDKHIYGFSRTSTHTYAHMCTHVHTNKHMHQYPHCYKCICMCTYTYNAHTLACAHTHTYILHYTSTDVHVLWYEDGERMGDCKSVSEY
jgi:hypothetical protein